MSYVKSVSGSDYRFLVRGVMLYHTCPWLNLLNGPLMFKRRYVTLLPLFVLLAACSSKPKPTETDTTTGTPSGGFLLEPQHNVMQMGGDFANNPNAQQFIDKMVNKHGFDRQQLQEILSQAKRLDSVLRLMDNQAPTTSVKPPSGPNGAWLRYRKKFITPDNVQNGVVFWNQYEDALNRAWQVYGVPPEIIVGIIGVETRWGRVMGKTRILDALATLSFNYPRRAEYFSGELETFLLMTLGRRNLIIEPLGLFRVECQRELRGPVQLMTRVRHCVIAVTRTGQTECDIAAWAAILLATMPSRTSFSSGRRRCSAGVT